MFLPVHVGKEQKIACELCDICYKWDEEANLVNDCMLLIYLRGYIHAELTHNQHPGVPQYVILHNMPCGKNYGYRWTSSSNDFQQEVFSIVQDEWLDLYIENSKNSNTQASKRTVQQSQYTKPLHRDAKGVMADETFWHIRECHSCKLHTYNW